MKIDPKSVLGNIQEAAETVASKAQEVVKETTSQTTQTVEKTVGSMQGATDAKGNLRLAGDTTRAKLDKAVNEFQKDVSNTALGAREGFDAGKKSGEQAHSDTNAQGPKFIAGLAGGIAGSISGAVDGFNVGKSGGSAEDIRNKARSDAELSGADAALRSQFLDTSDGERDWYDDYKRYQQLGGTKSYDDWTTERTKNQKGYAGGSQIRGDRAPGDASGSNQTPSTTESEESGVQEDPNDQAWNDLQDYAGGKDEYITDAESTTDPLEQLANYAETGENNPSASNDDKDGD